MPTELPRKEHWHLLSINRAWHLAYAGQWSKECCEHRTEQKKIQWSSDGNPFLVKHLWRNSWGNLPLYSLFLITQKRIELRWVIAYLTWLVSSDCSYLSSQPPPGTHRLQNLWSGSRDCKTYPSALWTHWSKEKRGVFGWQNQDKTLIWPDKFGSGQVYRNPLAL